MVDESKIFSLTYENYLGQMAGIDLESRAEQLGAKWVHPTLRIPFYGIQYRVSEKGVVNDTGEAANIAVSTVLCRYVLQCPEKSPKTGDWITYREFKGAGPLAGSFTTNTNKIIETHFSGHLHTLQLAATSLGGISYGSNRGYDLSMTFRSLPHVPVLLRFNDTDDQFPASSGLFFRQSAEAYLDMQSLSIAGTYLCGSLVGTPI